MPERRADKNEPVPWHAPIAVEDVSAETGHHVAIAADAEARAAIAQIAGLRELPRLEANFDVTRHGEGGLHVTGRVSATVGQNCVVTLEPLVNDIAEDVDLLFVAPAPPPHGKRKARADDDADQPADRPERSWKEPEPLLGGVVDLGALATEFLILGINPYPRQPGAVFEPPQDVKPDPGPFAALAGLTKVRDGQ
jgi:hypothetical protein